MNWRYWLLFSVWQWSVIGYVYLSGRLLGLLR